MAWIWRIEDGGCARGKLRNRTSIRGREVEDDGWRAGSDTGTGTHYSR